MAIQVRAKDLGVFGHLRHPGEEFSIPSEKQFSKKWMEKVSDDEDEPAKKGKAAAKAKAEPEADKALDSEVI